MAASSEVARAVGRHRLGSESRIPVGRRLIAVVLPAVAPTGLARRLVAGSESLSCSGDRAMLGTR